MAKTKTLKKPKVFSIDDMVPAKLKASVKTTSVNPKETLSNPKFIAKALSEALLDGDTDAFKEILRAHYDAVNKSDLLKEIGMSQRTFYSALSEKGNPSLDVIAKLTGSMFHRRQKHA